MLPLRTVAVGNNLANNPLKSIKFRLPKIPVKRSSVEDDIIAHKSIASAIN